ncbi:Mfa1 family fimbria major subunit [Segatella copri]|uniref:Mfa1 family fimbria major subunit n=1 Tax=Segatella copri TaxID=165179 RepID=UPI002FF210D8
MKIKHYFGLAVIAAMTASCSSNEDLGTAGPSTGNNEAGVGYATFTINLPTTSGTRAGGDPTYDQGTLDEYDVNDVTLLIFKKGKATKEGDYTFVEKANLGNMAPWKKDDTANGITASATITAKLTGVALTNEGSKSDYYALAILNNNADATGAGGKVTLPTAPTTSSTTESTTPPVTYGSWNAASNADETKFKDNTKGFYMANAPVYKNGEPTTLVNIDKVYATKQKAETNAATTIHVERGLAKVTVASADFTKTFKPSGTKYNNDGVKITAWNLDVTNNSTFPIHKTTGLNSPFTTIWSASTDPAPSTGRFVDAANSAFKRVHWGVDPNYSTDLDETARKNAFTILAPNAKINGTAKEPQYCLENTFDIKHMLQGQTTRVVFKAKYTPKDFADNETFYKIGNNTDLWNEENLKKQIKTVALNVMGITDPEEQKKYDVDLTKGTNISGKAGQHLIKADNITYTDEAASSEVKENVVKKINEKLNTINEKLGLSDAAGISTYLNGEAYYIARIKHFGDDLTPWNEGDETYGDDDETQNKKYLGRYGVLRNNWYELTVNSVSGPGTPDVPTIKPNVPDDESYKYISVSVKILSWAKRSQKVDL